MLVITVPASEYYDWKNNEFIYFKEQTLKMEHSLVSLSKWEAKWHKSFLSTENKTPAEMLDYFRCMTINENVDPHVYDRLSPDNQKEIGDYINANFTATTFSDRQQGPKSREIITAELIYYWMIELGIPFECQKWHLSRLLTLIKVCSIKSTPAKKMGRADTMRQYSQLNASRRKALGTRG